MKILVSGSTGMIGSAVVELARRQGHEVWRLVRPDPDGTVRTSAVQDEVVWDPLAGMLGPGAEGAEAVVHLAGASISDGRWTSARKRVLRDSRVLSTRQLVGALGKLRRTPKVFIAASAVGYYGSRGDEVLTEASVGGTDFLAQLAHDWEAESIRAQEFGARVTILRFGVVLSKSGGALGPMALPFRLGVGGPVGSGKQWMSWIDLSDVQGVVLYALNTNLLSGSVNVVSPQPVRNADFARELASALHRPAIFRTPRFILRLALGEMADALLLASQRALPVKLEQMGYRFQQPDLRADLQRLLND